MNLTNQTAFGAGALAANDIVSKLVLAVFILLLGFIAGRLVGLLFRRLFAEVGLDKNLRKAGVRMSLERLVSDLLSIIVYVLSVFFSLNTLGLTSAVVTVLILGIVFVLVLSFLLAVKDFFPNLMSGMRLRFLGLFSEGDEIQIKEVRGKITSLGFLETRILTSFNEELIIPNALFTKRKIVVRKKAAASKK